MVSGTATAEQRVLDASELDPGDSTAAAFAHPFSPPSKIFFSHLSPHVCLGAASQVPCKRDFSQSCLLLASFRYRSPKLFFFFPLCFHPSSAAKILVAEELPSDPEL